MMYPPEFFENLYREMVRIRMCEESLVEPIIRGDVRCPCHLYSGQEAIAVGVCAALQKEDMIFSSHRSHGHFLAKGGSMRELVAEVYGKESGCSRGRGGSMHLIDVRNGMMGSAPIVAGTIPLAVGAALALKIKRKKQVVVSFFGDGAAGEGVLYESMNFASLKKLPIIFACENNLYSTHMPIRECRPEDNVFQVAKPFCIKNYRIDGNDVLKVYEKSREALEISRSGQGPVFLEFSTYRLRGHVGPDDNIQGNRTDIRPEEEVDKWRKKDPLKRFEKYLVKNAILERKDFEKIKKHVKDEVQNAFDFAMSSPYPNEHGVLNYVFK
jgi:pyruvate dehydrogenase E1 component alpha subunit